MEENKHFKLLLIEDDPEDAFLIEELLHRCKNCKFEIKTASNMRDAANLMDILRFDIILTDLNLPDSQGLNTVKTVSLHANNMPFIVLTGLNDNETGLEALNNGAQDYLVKGKYTKEKLLQSVQYAVSRKRIEEDLRKNSNLLSSIFNDIPIILFLVDHELKVIKINKTGLSINNKSEKEVIGLRGGEFINCLNHLETPEGCGMSDACRTCALRNAVNDCFEKKSNFHNLESSLPIVSNGETVMRHFIFSVSYINMRNTPSVLVTLNDVTAKYQAEQELLKYQNELEEKVKQRTADLEKKNDRLIEINNELEYYNELFINREFRIKDLKEKLAYVEEELSYYKKK
jgi:CheY-like chemotaxis protein